MPPHPPHKSLEKRSVSRLSYLFAHLDLLSSETFSFLIFFLLLFSSLTLPISAFHLSILSEVWLLNFLRLLRTTKLAQSTSQYYFVQSLHKVLPSTTLYYKACTKHFPVIMCYKARDTTSYYKACKKHVPVLLCTKLAQSTSQYYFVLQDLHQILPSTTLYYKACAK